MKTKPTRQKDIQRTWHLVNAEGVVLGRLATRIAGLLRGKAHPQFTHHLDCGNFVIVINARRVLVTGKKEMAKTYTRYSGYPGGLKTITFQKMRAQQPEEIIRHAVSGMLPKNKLRDAWLTRLYIYKDKEHPYEKQLIKEIE